MRTRGDAAALPIPHSRPPPRRPQLLVPTKGMEQEREGDPWVRSGVSEKQVALPSEATSWRWWVHVGRKPGGETSRREPWAHFLPCVAGQGWAGLATASSPSSLRPSGKRRQCHSDCRSTRPTFCQAPLMAGGVQAGVGGWGRLGPGSRPNSLISFPSLRCPKLVWPGP